MDGRYPAYVRGRQHQRQGGLARQCGLQVNARLEDQYQWTTDTFSAFILFELWRLAALTRLFSLFSSSHSAPHKINLRAFRLAEQAICQVVGTSPPRPLDCPRHGLDSTPWTLAARAAMAAPPRLPTPPQPHRPPSPRLSTLKSRQQNARPTPPDDPGSQRGGRIICPRETYSSIGTSVCNM